MSIQLDIGPYWNGRSLNSLRVRARICIIHMYYVIPELRSDRKDELNRKGHTTLQSPNSKYRSLERMGKEICRINRFDAGVVSVINHWSHQLHDHCHERPPRCDSNYSTWDVPGMTWANIWETPSCAGRQISPVYNVHRRRRHILKALMIRAVMMKTQFDPKNLSKYDIKINKLPDWTLPRRFLTQTTKKKLRKNSSDSI